MAERRILPIPFRPEMVLPFLREIELPGTGKTMDRRVFKPRGFEFWTLPDGRDCYTQYRPYRDGTWDESRIVGGGPMQAFGWGEDLYGYLPYAPGNLLWVREAWISTGEGVWTVQDARRLSSRSEILYRANAPREGGPWWASIHMPREFSRITLKVTGVKVERLQNISRDDAMAEGIVQTWGDFVGDPPEWAVASINGYAAASGPHIYDNRTSVENFRERWNSIHGPDAWETNPWVAAYSLRPFLGNVDRLVREGVFDG